MHDTRRHQNYQQTNPSSISARIYTQTNLTAIVMNKSRLANRATTNIQEPRAIKSKLLYQFL